MSDEALRAACEHFMQRIEFDTEKYIVIPDAGDIDRLLDFAKQQRAAGIWEVLAKVRDARPASRVVAASMAYAHIEGWCEARAKEWEAQP